MCRETRFRETIQVTFNNFVPTLWTGLTDRLLSFLLRKENTFVKYMWLPLGVQNVAEQLDRSLSRLITGFFEQRLRFDSLPIHVKYIVGSSNRKFSFRGNSVFPHQAIPPMFHPYLRRLRNAPTRRTSWQVSANLQTKEFSFR